MGRDQRSRHLMNSPGFQLCIDSEGYAKDRGDGWVIAYWDANGRCWTIGFGSTGPDIKKGTTWTRDHAVLRLQQGWDNAQAGVLRASPILKAYPLMLDAITDFAYNCGVGAYQMSTLRRYVNAQRWQDASNELPKWNHAGGKVVNGLTVRRARERDLFLQQLNQAQATTQAVTEITQDQIAQDAVLRNDLSPTPNTGDSIPHQSPVASAPSFGKLFADFLRGLADLSEGNNPKSNPKSRQSETTERP